MTRLCVNHIPFDNPPQVKDDCAAAHLNFTRHGTLGQIPSNPFIDAALPYANRGWPVIPLHTPAGGTCDCWKKQDCTSPGKHPWPQYGLRSCCKNVSGKPIQQQANHADLNHRRTVDG